MKTLAFRLLGLGVILLVFLIAYFASGGCNSGSTPTTQPSINYQNAETAAADAVAVYQVVAPFLPAEDQVIGKRYAATATTTLTKIALDRSNGLPANQADLSALVPLVAQLEPLVLKANGIKAAATQPSK